MGQNRSTAAIGFFQRRPQPKYALLVIAGDNDNALAPRCCLWRRQRGLQWGPDRFAGRPECRGRRGGRGRNRTTQQSTGLSTKKTINNARWSGAGVGVALFLSCYCGALLSIGRAAESSWVALRPTEMTERSNNQPWGVVEKEGDDCGVVLLEVVCPENTTMNNC